jgi:predicted ribosome-associated RNA-binding protein Tma20
MKYNKLKSILKNNSEIHYITDSEIFFDENNININKFKNNKFILFEYTTNFIPTIKLLKQNNIKYSIHTDELELQFIII